MTYKLIYGRYCSFNYFARNAQMWSTCGCFVTMVASFWLWINWVLTLIRNGGSDEINTKPARMSECSIFYMKSTHRCTQGALRLWLQIITTILYLDRMTLIAYQNMQFNVTASCRQRSEIAKKCGWNCLHGIS